MLRFSLATSTLLLLLFHSSEGFTVLKDVSNRQCLLSLNAAPSAEESAKALGDYMAKSHESKLLAVKEVEDKKNAEIQNLKKELEEFKKDSTSSSSIVQASSSVVLGSVEDLTAKLDAYQKFMTSYIVGAQEDKFKAVKAAEASAALKYEEKLKLLPSAGPSPTPSPKTEVVVASSVDEIKSYAERNGKVAASGKAGKSRWGDMEVQKITTGDVSPTPPTSVASPVLSITSNNNDKRVFDPKLTPPEVIAADHGLRADGGIGGLTLAQRVALGPVANDAAESSSSVALTIFQKRNELIAAAGKTGKSRWGLMEIEKATEYLNALPPSSSIPVTPPKPEVIAADHGLRADGGVGGPSLSDRVNLGGKLLQA
mmetsp:Transcript_16682/g.16117  ORF Transcript_16682/g.16117 Transcript_16682/m.16117 type:complete len:370 (-) Transcript_16682:256-1365(-)|eukprot:CAMPEP_0197831974 /NCGR_PEP_ID=MMETSP1437-20131217/12877_1 /TAXON_ID=49252 ORGANISM="Eucampia antarctica, Strain CCMP1452" /NCGR_SAMPLE_ID=MMETSP1437 /ASSEMBLY_ACC=CAM_ASM_001096 /LENGTH=369 /DNA_ID=CAMNT_0043435129 /DNA_START=47 /DNA_END=1156 /DNA_ORIENTATION=-